MRLTSSSGASTAPFQPVDPAPTVYTAKAGSAIPVKFKLGGDKGLDVLAAGCPRTGPANCGGAATDEIEQTLLDAASAPSYDSASEQYTYTWTTTTRAEGLPRPHADVPRRYDAPSGVQPP